MFNKKINFHKIIAITIFLCGFTTMFAQEKQTVKKISKSPKNKIANKNYRQDCLDNPIYKKIIALKNQYPEGMKWTDSNIHYWKGGIYSWGSGCSGFAFLVSDLVFGNLPARKHYNFNNLRIGDILRIHNDTHSVVIICINSKTVKLVEGNYNSSIHWGRTFSLEEIKSEINYVLTRYKN